MFSSYQHLSSHVQGALLHIFRIASSHKDLNKIRATTSLEGELSDKEINKVAGTLTIEWVYQILHNIAKDPNNIYHISDVEYITNGCLEDIKIHMKDIDQPILIKVTSAPLEKGSFAGKGCNIVSFREIRSLYTESPDSIFIVLSVRNIQLYDNNQNRIGFSMIGFNVFDFKFVAANQLLLNKKLGDVFQISNSLNVIYMERATKEFIDLLDQKFIEKHSETELREFIANNYIAS